MILSIVCCVGTHNYLQLCFLIVHVLYNIMFLHILGFIWVFDTFCKFTTLQLSCIGRSSGECLDIELEETFHTPGILWLRFIVLGHIPELYLLLISMKRTANTGLWQESVDHRFTYATTCKLLKGKNMYFLIFSDISHFLCRCDIKTTPPPCPSWVDK